MWVKIESYPFDSATLKSLTKSNFIGEIVLQTRLEKVGCERVEIERYTILCSSLSEKEGQSLERGVGAK